MNISWRDLLFSFSGRINRAKWWLTNLIIALISIVVAILSSVIPTGAGLGMLLLGIAYVVGYVVYFWIYLAAGAKRLHDLDRTASWLVLFVGAPILLIVVMIGYVAFFIGSLDGDTWIAILAGRELTEADVKRLAADFSRMAGPLAIMGLLMFALSIWWLVWLGCLRGTRGPNRFGSDLLQGRA